MAATCSGPRGAKPRAASTPWATWTARALAGWFTVRKSCSRRQRSCTQSRQGTSQRRAFSLSTAKLFSTRAVGSWNRRTSVSQ
jgi:hypothetical protein